MILATFFNLREPQLLWEPSRGSLGWWVKWGISYRQVLVLPLRDSLFPTCQQRLAHRAVVKVYLTVDFINAQDTVLSKHQRNSSVCV